MKDMDNKMLNKCREWLGDDVSSANITLIHKEDDSVYHQRIYMAAWNDDDGFTHAYIIRVFTCDNGNCVNLSQDYEIHVLISDFVNWMPEIFAKIRQLTT